MHSDKEKLSKFKKVRGQTLSIQCIYMYTYLKTNKTHTARPPPTPDQKICSSIWVKRITSPYLFSAKEDLCLERGYVSSDLGYIVSITAFPSVFVLLFTCIIMKPAYWNQGSILCISVCGCKWNLLISTLIHNLLPSQFMIKICPIGFH